MTVDAAPAWRELPTTEPEMGAVPEPLLARVLEFISRAEEFIVVSSYVLGADEIVDALEELTMRGRRCYILTAAEEQLRVDRFHLSAEDRLSAPAHQVMLDRCSRFAMIRTGSGFHAKFLLRDGPDGSGMLLTANIRRGALWGNDELAVDLQPAEVVELFAVARWAFHVAAERQLVGPGRLMPLVPLMQVQMPASSALSVRGQHADQIAEILVRAVRSSTGRLVATSFSWGLDHPLVAALITASRRRRVTVVANSSVRSSLPALREMAAAGITVLGRERLHAKALRMVDGEVIISTANFRNQVTSQSSLDLALRVEASRAMELAATIDRWAASATHGFGFNEDNGNGTA